MWTKMIVIVLNLLLSFSATYGQGTQTPADKKRTTTNTQAKVPAVPAVEFVNLLPRMHKTALREGRNVIYTTRTGTQLIATVRQNSLIGYDVVNSRGESLPMTIIPDPVQKERAREMQESIDRAAQNAAEYKHCRELLGWWAQPPIQKGCWVFWEDEDGLHHAAYNDCKKGY